MYIYSLCYMGVSEIRGTLLWGPYNKDPTIWGTTSGSPIFGNSHLDPKLCTYTVCAIYFDPEVLILNPFKAKVQAIS